MQVTRYLLLFIVFTGLMLITRDIPLYAQHENVWAFGYNAGIDFNTNPPTPIHTGIYTREGSASICDGQGQLLFYTDGTSVWDRNHNIMPNGNNLTGVSYNITASTSQGALIVPVPESFDQYYIFSLGEFAIAMEFSPYLGRLSYSIVDMNLNGGLGAVTKRAVVFDSLLTEHMTAVSGNTCDVWLIAVSRINNSFKAYSINSNGISTNPVISPGTPERKLEHYSQYSGAIDIATDHSKLAIAQDNVVLYNFDANTGKITHPVVLDTGFTTMQPITVFPDLAPSTFYGVCFSPDNSKLYISMSEPPRENKIELYQFDLSSGDSLSMAQSKTLISDNKISAMKRAPDGKVYTTAPSPSASSQLNVIRYPDSAGVACGFSAKDFLLFPGTASVFGLTNLATIFPIPPKIYNTIVDSSYCSHARILKAKELAGTEYLWDDSTRSATRIVDSPGTYWVRYKVVNNNSPCKDLHVDTFKVIFHLFSKNIYTTTTESGLCKADTIVMRASNGNGIDYIWEDGNNGKERKINKTGIYWVSYRVDSLCENHADSFIITYPDPEYKVSFSVDTLVCQGERVIFQNTSNSHFNNFTWRFGDGDSSVLINPPHAYAHPGSYRVRLIGHIDAICPDTAYQTIVADSIFPVQFLTDRDSICTGQSISFNTGKDSTSTKLAWQFGDGNELSGLDETNIHHAYDRSGILEVTLSRQFRACPDTSFTHTIYVSALPKVYLGADTHLCLHGAPILLKNLQEPPTEAYHTLWSTGDTTETLKVEHPGTYSLTVSTESLGCNATETITVNKNCYMDIPNTFTPNGDGVNDYFFPRQLLSGAIERLRMQIFNRWGQLLFETTNTYGRGWDGKYNNKEQPAGGYIYTIDIVLTNGRQEQYTGNVTLIR